MWKLSNDRPIFQQIIDKINTDIACSKYTPGQKLDSVRELAAEAGVNPNTMQRALSELERDGILFSKRGDGRYVCEDVQLIENLKNSIINTKTEEYITSLKAIGFKREEIVVCLKNKLEEE